MLKVSNNVLAYWVNCNGSTIAEPLIEHSRRCSKKLKEIDSSPLSRYIRLKISVDPVLLKEVINLAAVTHDFGKVFFQGNIKRDEKGCKRLSFIGHEIFSAFLIHEINVYIRKQGFKCMTQLIKAAEFAVLFHHHAMHILRRKDRAIKLLSGEGSHEVRGWSEVSEVIDDVKALSNYIMNPYLRSAYSDIAEEVLRIEDYEGIILLEIRNSHELWRNALGSAKERVLYLSMLIALIAGDYLAAAESRGEAKSVFSGVIKDLAQTYLGASEVD